MYFLLWIKRCYEELKTLAHTDFYHIENLQCPKSNFFGMTWMGELMPLSC